MTYHPPIGHSWRSLGHTSMTITSTAKMLTNDGTYTIPVSTQLVRIHPENGSVRWLGHGSSPTATKGNLVTSAAIEYVSGLISSIQLIRAGAANVTLSVDFQGYKG